MEYQQRIESSDDTYFNNSNNRNHYDFEVDLTTIRKYQDLCSAIEILKIYGGVTPPPQNHDDDDQDVFATDRRRRDGGGIIRSAKITCRDRVSNRLMTELGSSCPFLTELSLNLESCRLPPQTRELVQEILLQTRGVSLLNNNNSVDETRTSSLKVLRIDFGLMPRFETALENHPTLERIHIQAKSCTIQQWERLILTLSTCPTLKSIKLIHAGGCLPHNTHNLFKHSLERLVAGAFLPELESLQLINIPTIGVPIFHALAGQQQQQQSQLKKLVVSTTFRWSGDYGIQAVANMLQHNSTLESLTISAIMKDHESMLPIFRVLKESNRTLKQLHLCRGTTSGGSESEDNNNSTKQQEAIIVDMLRHNHVLQDISFFPNRRTTTSSSLSSLWPAFDSDIRSYLNLNRLRLRLTEQPPTIQHHWLDLLEIAHMIDHHVRLIHFILSMNPSLCIVNTATI